MFYLVSCNAQSGALVAVIRGANCPLLVQTITDQLAHEHKVLEGMAERREVKLNLLTVFIYLMKFNYFYVMISYKIIQSIIHMGWINQICCTLLVMLSLNIIALVTYCNKFDSDGTEFCAVIYYKKISTPPISIVIRLRHITLC